MKNLDKYLSLLGEQVDGLLLTSRYSRHYGAEFDIAEGVAIVSEKGCRYFTDSRYIEAAQNGIRDFEVLMTDREHPYSQLLNEAIADFGITALGYEENYLTVAEFNEYVADLNAKLIPMHTEISGFRHVKEPWEL
ncbi:MAG: aminopeptidase P family N-terminal domain-containing protein, partial [Oscillospiraceae bacterium]|nr:aminopeptidase P family N-terminal domain-containing protein [Oscillospiraceae bacterium]